jgi:hypothetical protein
MIEHVIKVKGFDNVKYFCIINEMHYGQSHYSRDQWRTIHTAVYNQLKSRGLENDVGLLATDQVWNWGDGNYNSIGWAAQNFDNMNGIYGGHAYLDWDFNDQGLDCNTTRTYPMSVERWSNGVGQMRSTGKHFLVGEFGVGRCLSGQYYGRILTEMACAGINNGVSGMCNWLFCDAGMDFWGNFGDGGMGLFRNKSSNFAIKPGYWGWGLMTKYFCEGLTTYATETDNNQLYAAAGRNTETDRWSILAINRTGSNQTISFEINGKAVNTQLRRYLHDPGNLPNHSDGFLQAYDKLVDVVDGEFSDQVPNGCFAIYTNDPNPTGHDPELPVITVEGPAGRTRLPVAIVSMENGIMYLGGFNGLDAVVEIFGLNGQKVFSASAGNGDSALRFDMNGKLAPGSFLCRVRTKDSSRALLWTSNLIVAR